MSDAQKNDEEPTPKPKSERRRKKYVLAFRVSPKEARRLRKAAANTNHTMSSWLRALALEALGQPEMSRPELVRLNSELNRIGVNLNQMAKHANTHGRIERQKELHATVVEIMVLQEQIRKALE